MWRPADGATLNTLCEAPDMRIEIQPRLHVGLISMQAGGARKNGGLGFSISAPCGLIDIYKSDIFSLDDTRQTPLPDYEVKHYSKLIDSTVVAFNLNHNISVRLSGNLQSHVGLGAGTGFRLAMLEGLFLLNGFDAHSIDLVRLSKRGGTSGVGINTYFSGGLVMDLGIPNDQMPFAPSSKADANAKPLALPPLVMPDWPLCLCMPESITPKTQQEEAKFFSDAKGVTVQEAYETAYQFLFGIYASVAERNFSNFCDSINRIQEIGWKSDEWHNYEIQIYNVAAELRNIGAAAVGMSSFGPMLYCFAEERRQDLIVERQESLGCRIAKVWPSNHGRRVAAR